jgi:predicted secreted protein
MGGHLMKLQKLSLISRRKAMALIAGTSIAINIPTISHAADNKALKRIKEITNNKGAKELDIFFDVPEIAENGNQVKVNFEIESPMEKDDFIKNVYILADGNPPPMSLKFLFPQKWVLVQQQPE